MSKLGSKSWFENMRDSKFRHLIWPIKSSELNRFIPMSVFIFTILLNQNLVRPLKDTIVVLGMSSEVLSFIKLWAEMPIGIMFFAIYAKLCNHFTTEHIFRIVVSSFLFFFFLFSFVILPNQDFFHPSSDLVAHYRDKLPHLGWFVLIWGKWSYVLFYALAELWPVVVGTLFFWQLANKIIKPEEANRFYSFFALFGYSNLLFSGSLIVYFAKADHFLMFLFNDLTDNTEILFKSLTIMVIISGVCSLFIHRFIELQAIENNVDFKVNNKRIDILNLNLKDSTKLILSSSYLMLILVLHISYSTSINFIEGVWMSKTKELYNNVADFITYQGNVLFWTGISTMIAAFVGSLLIRKFGWFAASLCSPVMILFAGTMFFSSVLLQDFLEIIMIGSYVVTPLMLVVFMGGMQNFLGKGVKYSMADATREMAYLAIKDKELKVKGKAATDVMGAKIGKVLGSFIQFMIFTIFPGARHDNIAWFLAILFAITCLGWIFAVKKLSKRYQELTTD